MSPLARIALAAVLMAGILAGLAAEAWQSRQALERLEARAAFARAQSATLARLSADLDRTLLSALLGPSPERLPAQIDRLERDSMHRLGVLDNQTATELSFLGAAERQAETEEQDRPEALRAELERILDAVRQLAQLRLARGPVPQSLPDLAGLDAARVRFGDLAAAALADEAGEIADAEARIAARGRAHLLVGAGGAAAGLAVLAGLLLPGLLALGRRLGDLRGRLGAAGPQEPATGDALDRLEARLATAEARAEAQAAAAERARTELAERLQRRRAELELSNARLREIDSTRRRFLGDIGHALKTPLAVARGSVENLAQGRGTEAGPGLARALSALDALAERLSALTALARSEDGRLLGRAQELELYELLDSRIAALRILPGGDRFRLESALEAPLEMRGDRQDLERLFDAVLENALEHAAGAGPVEVHLARAAGMAVVTVADRGPGLGGLSPEAALARREGPAEGRGIGLAMARQIAGEAGGSIALAPGEEGGLVVTIRLPEGGGEADGNRRGRGRSGSGRGAEGDAAGRGA
ncbi:HAMP domain-containing sensor histidine kinase [Poseidonocella sp. HB161398]|uniref:sensor histidine kinase n=1 Tax=Poseidonocella sp. HB161398 TaxID=2320855 RepID=UPI001109E985|nr:HAMP domain-containing sensor histidine kinase [Poseidonocella sp. HB161398]